MPDHYYTEKPVAAHERQMMKAVLRGRTFNFITDAGVFSKRGVDYGSKVLIDYMEIAKDAAVLDVGCGYGPIGLTAAMLASHGTVTMIDINERAVQLAQENAKLNGISNVNIMQSDLFEEIRGSSFTTILTNPPIRAGKDVVHQIFVESREHLIDGGALWVVIQKKQGAPSAYAKLESLFSHVVEVGKDKGYRVLKAVK